MSTAGALLSYVKVLVEVNDAVGAGVNAALTAGALHRVYDNQPVISLIDDTFYRAGRDARGIIAVHAQDGKIVHLNLGHSSPDKLILLQPELPGVWLWGLV